LTPVRLMKNKFFNDVQTAYQECATPEQLNALLGRGRAKKGMFEGDMEEGELEIGQISGLIDRIQSTQEVFDEILSEYRLALEERILDKFQF
jgi:enoyl-[acyl-carrier protein] reductase II